PAGDWARNEDFGFLTSYIIRPNFGPCAPIYLKGSIETIDGEPNSLKVVPQGGKSPYAYQWDDPLAQNTAIATNLTAGRAYTVQIEDDNGCIKTITSNVLGDDPTNIEIPFLSSWQLFPNPTDGLISWEADWQKPVSGNWRLLSIEGKVLQEKAFSEGVRTSIQIDLGDLPSGIYLLEIRSTEGLFSTPIQRR
ncbi:MAG: T9SS type A sorting domain-containing protein, partial [Bacteroidota bacterium]